MKKRINPRNIKDDWVHTIRGGSRTSHSWKCRCTHKNGRRSGYRYNSIGFRLLIGEENFEKKK